MINIALFEPEIPQNTGNIMRLAVNCGFRLFLIKPYGFILNEKNLKRSAMDYIKQTDYYEFDNFTSLITKHKFNNIYAYTTKVDRIYTSVAYTSNDLLVYGPETRGLPDWILKDKNIIDVTIPMKKISRSINLANSVAIGAMEVWRQLGFN